MRKRDPAKELPNKKHMSNHVMKAVSTSSFRFVDLFCGIGGFHHALASLGGKCVFACELDNDCRRVYREAFPELRQSCLARNIREITRKDPDSEASARSIAEISRLVPDHDVLCGGFPCQPFSKSGSQHGIRDKTRGTLFHDIMEIIRAKKPRYVILENVRNLAGPRHRATWQLIIESFRQYNYRIADEPVVLSPHLIPPHLGGTPQARERVFILAELMAKTDPRELICRQPSSRRPFPTWNPDKWRIRDYLTPDAHIQHVDEYRLSEDELMWIEAWDFFLRRFQRDELPSFPLWAHAFRMRTHVPDDAPGWKRDFLLKNAAFYRDNKRFIDSWLSRQWGSARLRVDQFPRSRQKFEWQARKAYLGGKTPTLRQLVLQFRPSGIRVKPPTYLPALVAITQTSVIGPDVAKGIEQYRRLTPIEAATLQGIPSAAFERARVSDRVAYRQLGNAVSVGVVRFAFQALVQGAYASDKKFSDVDNDRPLLRMMGSAS